MFGNYNRLRSLIRSRRPLGRRGQTLLEFIMVFALIFGVTIMVVIFLNVFRAHGGRVLDLMAWDYP